MEGCKWSGAALGDCSQEHLVDIRDEKVSLFVKFEISYPFFVLQISTAGHGVPWLTCGEIPGPVKSKEFCCPQGKSLIIIT